MEIFLKIADDADEWLQMAWLASGTLLWLLITLFVTALLFAGSMITPGAGWLIGALCAVCVALAPVIQNS